MYRFFITFLVIFSVAFAPYVRAQSTDISALQSQVDNKSAQIQALQKEIDQYNSQVTAVAGETQTLQNTIKSLDLTAKKLQATITLTKTKISQTNDTIAQLSGSIGTAKTQITHNTLSLAESVRSLSESETTSPFENFLVHKSFIELWDDVEKLQQFQQTITLTSKNLTNLTVDLTDKKKKQENQKKQLLTLQQDLIDQQKIIQQNSQEKAVLLAQTKNQEANYRKILADKKAQVTQYEKDLFDYESQIKLITNASQIPTAEHNILSWPLDAVYITQMFGVTNASARLYVSGSHNGVDFRAPIGTPVKAALAGTVVGTGDTDIFPGCYSFGRWVMIKHTNGLSTIYAHLSLIKASVGQNVTTGDIIGLSGYSGYVYPAGPAGAHLHLGVYATAGVQIKQFTQSIGCKQAVVPIADIKAYLDPLLYLPNYSKK